MRAIEEDLWHVMDGAVFDSTAAGHNEVGEQGEGKGGGGDVAPPFLAGDEVLTSCQKYIHTYACMVFISGLMNEFHWRMFSYIYVVIFFYVYKYTL